MNRHDWYTCYVCGDIELEYVHIEEGIKLCSQGCLDALDSTILVALDENGEIIRED